MVIYSGFSHEKWWFSIAMLNYQRVNHWISTIPFFQWTAAVLLLRLRCGCLSHPTLREALGPQCRGKPGEPHGAWEALENPVLNTVIFPKRDGKYFSDLLCTSKYLRHIWSAMIIRNKSHLLKCEHTLTQVETRARSVKASFRFHLLLRKRIS